MFPGAARDLFEVPDKDVVMGSRSRSSLCSAAYPPTTDDDDFYEAISASKVSTGSDPDEGSARRASNSHHSLSRRAATLPSDNEDEHSLSASEAPVATNRGRVHRSGNGGMKRLEKRFNDEVCLSIPSVFLSEYIGTLSVRMSS